MKLCGSSLKLTVPGVKSEELEVKGEPPLSSESEATPTSLAWFLLGVLQVAGETEQLLQLQPAPHPQPLLPRLLGHCLLLLSGLMTG